MDQLQFQRMANTQARAWHNFDGYTGKDEPLASCVIPGPLPSDIIVEEQINDLIHIHYGDIRLEMTHETFRVFAQLMCDALSKL
jgi:hypothetical protein